MGLCGWIMSEGVWGEAGMEGEWALGVDGM